jgi:hypothetical protein
MNGRFFQFPLCALSFPGSERERLNNIISFSCLEVGKQQWQKFTQIEKDLRRLHAPSDRHCICKIDLTNDAHQQAVAGAQHLKIIIERIDGIVANHARLAHFIHEFERKHGADAQVRLATNFVFEARDNKGMFYRELAVLAAIYSKIGAAKGPVRITREEIWRRALGFKSKRVFSEEMRDCQARITQRKVRSIIERLHDRRFFARLTFARRQTYYSHRLTADQLAEAVFVQKLRPELARQARTRANDALTKRIQAERRMLAGQDAGDGAADDAT